MIDSFATVALGQSIAIIAPAGVGKTSLISRVIDSSQADITVLALVGERSREIEEFINRAKKLNSKSFTTIVASSSSASYTERAQAAETAMAYAEYFRDCGLRVLLVVDSLTRLARAWRDEALANGEMPSRQGYPVSVFERLPQILERGGSTEHGSITALYTMLAREELIEDPLIEEVCSVTDGHLLLSGEMAARGIYPALDITKSLSRMQTTIISKENFELSRRLRDLIVEYEKNVELIKLSSINSSQTSPIESRYHKILTQLTARLDYSSVNELFDEIRSRLNDVLCIKQQA
ncbi:UNVERIFIED_CONTAM: hypothetical protein GTU68_006295 [Idotea baltica]|nr:hypothetical protein [Idotea baltica]